MKILKCGLTCLLLAASMSSHATIRTYNFTSHVSTIYESNLPPGSLSPTESSWLGSTIRIGDAIVGQFSYDDAPALPPRINLSNNFVTYEDYYYDGAVMTFSFSVPSANYTFTADIPNTPFIIRNSHFNPTSGWDDLSITSNTSDLNLSQTATVGFFWNWSQAYDGNQIPPSISLSDFGSSGVYLNASRNSDGSFFSFNGNIESLSPVANDVPEPATYLTLATGIFMFGMIGRRRLRKQP